MSKVETMRGVIVSSSLGRVLVHEHIFLTDMEYIANYRPDFDEDALVEEAVAELDALKALGIDTIVDLTVLGLGRDIPRIARVAERTSLQIIVATGVYTFDHVPVAELVRRGDGDRMALSHDCACWAHYLPTNALRHQLLPDHRYWHVCQTVVPALLEAGVSQRDLDRMFIDNPRRHFEGAAERFEKRL